MLVLQGRIDERSSLAGLAERVAGRAVIDLEGVSFVNSMGLREWIGLLRALDARGTEVELVRCSEFMVSQMNMVVDACGRATVASFHAPYTCPSCDREASVHIEIRGTRDALVAGRPPPAPCPECGEAMDFDGIPERDFGFLRGGAR